MSNKKPKFQHPVSPIGIAKYCWVNNPDKGFDGKNEPKYKTRIVIEDTEENRAWVENVLKVAQVEAKANDIKLKKVFKSPFQFPEDQDEEDFIPQAGKERPKLDEDHRGRIYFDAKSSFKPGLIDSARKELPEDVKIMSGDKIKIKVEVLPYDGLGSGVSLRLKVVQLIEKNTTYSGSGKPNVEGFDDVEGGYTAGSYEDF